MSASLKPNRQATQSGGQFMVISSYSPLEPEGGSRAQETIWQLQDEVRILQEELVRTRRAVEQREVLLRNARQRELELRAEVGAEQR